MTPSADTRRPENLALIFQDVLTAIERLRANRQGVTDANAFRHHTREALKTAASQALAAGYTADDTRHATFAAVAFLDESVLNSQNPIFADWLRKPLQEELFGTHIAGEEFFFQPAATAGPKRFGGPCGPASRFTISACCWASAAATARAIAASWRKS